MRRQTPVTAFHRWIWWSAPPLASSRVSGWAITWGAKASDRTQFSCPARVRRHVPVPTSHSLTVLSPPALSQGLAVWAKGDRKHLVAVAGQGFSPAHRPPPSTGECSGRLRSWRLSGHRGCRPPPAPSCHAPGKLTRSCPVWLSHTRTWQSVSPVASHWPLGAKGRRQHIAQRFSKYAVGQVGPGKIDPVQLHVLQVGLPHRQP